MKASALATAILALAGCVSLPVERTPGPAPVTTARAVHLARVRCLLVAPFENASDDPLAAEAATAAFVSGIDATRTSIYPISELRALFKDTSMELPEGVSPSLALELGELIGADAALYGAVEGRSRGPDPEVTVTIRLTATGARDLLFSRAVSLSPSPDVPLADQVRAAIREAAAPMVQRLGVPGRKVCFDRQRIDRLRLVAVAGEQRAIYPPSRPVTAPLPPAPPPAAAEPASAAAQPQATFPQPSASAPPALAPPPPPPQVAEVGEVEILTAFPKIPRPGAELKVESAADLPQEAVAVPSPPPSTVREPRPSKPPRAVSVASARADGEGEAPGAKPRALTVRQAEWLTKLQRGGRVILEDVGFAGRTGLLERESGLHDVVALLGVASSLRVRVEGFVDSSNDPDGDLRVSMEMARAAGKRLIELGVARDRLSWAGRGGDSPLLPNFTARGRQSNRRIELVPAP